MTPPRRVLFFTPHLAGAGAERVMVQLLQRMDRARVAPSLAMLRMEGAFLADVPDDVPRIRVPARRVATSVPALAQLLRRERPDVVFTAGGANVVVSLAHRLSRSRSRLVLSERSALWRDDRTPRRNRALIAAKRATYGRADLVTSVSEGLSRDLVRRLRLAEAKVRTVWNPIVDDALLARSREPVDDPWFAPGAPPVVLAVGRLVEVKDYPTLLDAFAKVRAARACRLAVLGDGPLRADLEARVAAMGLGEAVRFLGFDVNPFRYMRRAAVLLHSSRAEGLPGVHIQAAACGTPVVSTDCDFGPREVIQASGTDGVLVPVGDADGLAAAVGRLLDDEGLRDRMGQAARASVERFRTERVLANYEQALLGVP